MLTHMLSAAKHAQLATVIQVAHRLEALVACSHTYIRAGAGECGQVPEARAEGAAACGSRWSCGSGGYFTLHRLVETHAALAEVALAGLLVLPCSRSILK